MEWLQNNWINIFVGLGFIGLLLRGPLLRKLNGVASISAKDLAEKFNTGRIILLDCRTPSEFASSHIKGAKLIPMRELIQNARNYFEQYKEKEIAVICATGGRSISPAIALKKAGVKCVYNVQGGMFACSRVGQFSLNKN